MENASKALIIAGAILLAILLISLGIMIFTQAQDTVNNSGMSQADIQSFNNKFIKYEGTNKSGSEVKAMINEIITSNNDENNTNRKIKIKIRGNTNYSNYIYPTETSSIDTSKKYKVSVKYAENTDVEAAIVKGAINQIYIE